MRDVNITITNVRRTGTNVQIPQRAAAVTIAWVDDEGVAHSDNRPNVLIPNIWNNAAIPDGWLQERLMQLTIDAIRLIVGIDEP
jgi:hypothetical protein